MTTKRKPTLKQMFATWKKYQKIQYGLVKLQTELNSMAQEIEYSSALIRDGDSVYRITSNGRYGAYSVTELACAEELDNLLINS